MGLITITRKISLNIADNVKEGYEKLYSWNEQVFRAANTAASHMYFQNNMREFFYLTDRGKILFSDINKPIDSEKMNDKERGLIQDGYERVLNTSKQNTTYQVLSDHFKGTLPADIYSNLNAQLAATFAKETKEYFSGKRSLRSYKRDMPMPISAKSIRNIKLTEDEKNYSFTILGINFKTFFGFRGKGNDKKIMFERSLLGEYKLCNSSIQLDGKRIYLNAVFQFESDKFKLDPEIVMYAELSAQFPITLRVGENKFNIGDAKEYLWRRIGIQGSLRRQQIVARFNEGGRGRERKMINIERFRKKEYHYIHTKQHIYTHKVIDLCLQNKCGKLMLKFTPDPIPPDDLNREELILWKEKNLLLLRNWGYRGLKDKIAYKCKKAGIELIEEKKTK